MVTGARRSTRHLSTWIQRPVLGPRQSRFTTNTEIACVRNGSTVSATNACPVLSLDPGGRPAGPAESCRSRRGPEHARWLQGTSPATFGSSVTVASFTVTSLTTATHCREYRALPQPSAPHTITVTTSSKGSVSRTASRSSRALPAITQVNPSSGRPGQQSQSSRVSPASNARFAQGTTHRQLRGGRHCRVLDRELGDERHSDARHRLLRPPSARAQ